MDQKSINWTKVLGNLGGTAVGAGGILALVPVEYQIPAAIGLALISNLIGAIQKSAIRNKE